MILMDRMDQVILTTIPHKLVHTPVQTKLEESCYSQNNFSEIQPSHYGHISCFNILKF